MSFITNFHKPPYDQLCFDGETNIKIRINRKYPPSGTQIYTKNSISFICMQCLLEGRLEQMYHVTPGIPPTGNYESFTLDECEIHGKTRYAQI